MSILVDQPSVARGQGKQRNVVAALYPLAYLVPGNCLGTNEAAQARHQERARRTETGSLTKWIGLIEILPRNEVKSFVESC